MRAVVSYLRRVIGHYRGPPSEGYARMQRDCQPNFVLIPHMDTDILADLENWLKQLVRGEWHKERVGEEIALVNRAIAEIERLRAAERSKRPKQHQRSKSSRGGTVGG